MGIFIYPVELIFPFRNANIMGTSKNPLFYNSVLRKRGHASALRAKIKK